jgi:TPP-dependent pyruvate/acetoin dehydrogenase alpha subunit
VGACAALSDADKITAAYRGHGWVVEADILPPSVLTWSGGDKMNNTEVRHAAR